MRNAPILSDLQTFRTRFDAWINAYCATAAFDDASAEHRAPDGAGLEPAFRYALSGRGKRLRPFLVDLIARSANPDHAAANAKGACLAVEFVHQASLIHDDLPCMDHGVIRHGRNALHVDFGEEIAVLTGDALLAHAFEALSGPDSGLSPGQAVAAVNTLARSIGARGMAEGQALDLRARATGPEELAADPAAQAGREALTLRARRLKTGSLMHAAFELGAIVGSASPEERACLAAVSYKFGEAYQLQDDLEEWTRSPQACGKMSLKPARSDPGAPPASRQAARAARRRIDELHDDIARSLNALGGRWEELETLLRLLARRELGASVS